MYGIWGQSFTLNYQRSTSETFELGIFLYFNCQIKSLVDKKINSTINQMYEGKTRHFSYLKRLIVSSTEKKMHIKRPDFHAQFCTRFSFVLERVRQPGSFIQTGVPGPPCNLILVLFRTRILMEQPKPSGASDLCVVTQLISRLVCYNAFLRTRILLQPSLIGNFLKYMLSDQTILQTK